MTDERRGATARAGYSHCMIAAGAGVWPLRLSRRRASHVRCGVLAAAAAVAVSAAASDLPPDYLIGENCQKAMVIVEGAVVDSTKERAFTLTQIRVRRVYRGNIRVGDVLTYASFRDTAPTGNLIVFLTGSAQDARAEWGTAIDFSEFPTSPALVARTRRCAAGGHR
jgi:hypothetical protein